MKILVCVLVFVYYTTAEEKYTTKYDSIDYDAIIRSERLLKNYVNCLLDKGGCTPDAKELRRLLPDALNTGCTKCSDVQKQGARKVILHLANNKDEWWEDLLAKYDPDGVFKEKYEDEWLNTN